MAFGFLAEVSFAYCNVLLRREHPIFSKKMKTWFVSYLLSKASPTLRPFLTFFADKICRKIPDFKYLADLYHIWILCTEKSTVTTTND